MLGQVLKCIRISQGRKPKEVADELKISITRVCDIEAGRRNVTLNSLETFATFYQLPASKILEWEEQAKSKSMCYQEILLLCTKYECERLHSKENNITR